MCKSELNHSVIEMVPLQVWLLNGIVEGWERKRNSQDKTYLLKIIITGNLHNFLFKREALSDVFKCKLQTTIFGYPYSAIINCFCFIKMLGDTVMDI